MRYTCPITGEEKWITPSADPDTYPFGYFGAPLGTRLPMLSPDEQIAIYQFWIEQREQLPRPQAEHDREARRSFINRWQVKIDWIKEHRMEEMARLLKAKTAFLDRLTIRDRAVVEAELARYRAALASVDLDPLALEAARRQA